MSALYVRILIDSDRRLSHFVSGALQISIVIVIAMFCCFQNFLYSQIRLVMRNASQIRLSRNVPS